MLTQGPSGNTVFIAHEEFVQRDERGLLCFRRESRGNLDSFLDGKKLPEQFPLPKLDDGVSVIKLNSKVELGHWQFLGLSPDRIGHPVPEQQATQRLRLARDGATSLNT